VPRALGLDLGARRIGVALSDSAGTVATPYETVQRVGDRRREHRRLAELVEETGAEIVVVGLPRSLDGSEGPAARTVRQEVAALRATLGVTVETYDERFTTVSAERSLRAMDVRGPRRRQVVDQVAAAVLLQAWLDQGDHRLLPPEEHQP
jgi:putative holliday junction resolvase